MELMAYKSARLWLRESDQLQKSLTPLPTPLQYGIALKMTSAPGLFSAWSYFRYSIIKTRKAPRMLTLLGLAMMVQIFLGTEIMISVAALVEVAPSGPNIGGAGGVHALRRCERSLDIIQPRSQ